MAQSQLHFIGGGHILVARDPKDVAHMLWAVEVDYAVLDEGTRKVYVNPATVTHVQVARPTGGPEDYRITQA